MSLFFQLERLRQDTLSCRTSNLWTDFKSLHNLRQWWQPLVNIINHSLIRMNFLFVLTPGEELGLVIHFLSALSQSLLAISNQKKARKERSKAQTLPQGTVREEGPACQLHN